MVRDSIAVILARGGSKRIPKKNIIKFKDKPLIAWTIDAAISSNLFTKVLVSTDSNEIAKVSANYGAEVPFLRDSANDDFSSASQATCRAVEQAEEYWGTKFNIVVQLMANCPLRSSKEVKDSMKNFIEKKAKSQISCFKFCWMNPWWAIKIKKDGRSEKLFPEASTKRSQDMPDLFCPTGAIWIAKRSNLMSSRNFYIKDTTYYPINWISAVDIDNYEDLEMANLCYDLKLKKMINS